MTICNSLRHTSLQKEYGELLHTCTLPQRLFHNHGALLKPQQWAGYFTTKMCAELTEISPVCLFFFLTCSWVFWGGCGGWGREGMGRIYSSKIVAHACIWVMVTKIERERERLSASPQRNFPVLSLNNHKLPTALTPGSHCPVIHLCNFVTF